MRAIITNTPPLLEEVARSAGGVFMYQLSDSVKTGKEAQRSIDSNSQPDYREKLNAELKALHDSEMWRTAEVVRQLRPENK